ncbi:MAG TPA: nucleotidyltransferase family protein [Candidatus Brocadiia bacterium]|nr:nucleotidyltransferase family protein [Planctomycetota bacterium]MDO8094709.1 nucleotidyltransferase family protein [Candidatus Brocadiales bacterium]
MTAEILTKDEIIEKLRDHKDKLKKYGVKRIALFGSYIRGEQKRKSDIDLVVEFDPTFFGEDFNGLFDAYIGLSSFLEELFGKKVDILTPVSIETIRIKEVAEEIRRSLTYV